MSIIFSTYRCNSLKNRTSYYPFGMPQPQRNYNPPTPYRYGFGGQEKVDEINEITGSHYTALFWEYDSRTGRRWNVDIESKKYPFKSPYSAFSNNPILRVDPKGDDDYYFDKSGNIIRHDVIPNKADNFYIASKTKETVKNANGSTSTKDIVKADFQINMTGDLGTMARAVYSEMGMGTFTDKQIVAESIRNRMKTKDPQAKGASINDIVNKGYEVADLTNPAYGRYTNPEKYYKNEEGGTEDFLESMQASIKAIYEETNVGCGVTTYNTSIPNLFDNNPGYVELNLPEGANEVVGMWSFKADSPAANSSNYQWSNSSSGSQSAIPVSPMNYTIQGN